MKHSYILPARPASPMIACVRRLMEAERCEESKIQRLKDHWPEIMREAPGEALPWDEMDPVVLEFMAKLYC